MAEQSKSPSFEHSRMDIHNSDIIDFLDSAYGISNVDALVQIDNGDWNTIYRIRSDQDWILRLSHKRKTPAQLDFELSVVSNLSSRLDYIPRIKPVRDGALFANHRGKYCSVFEFMPGAEITETADAVAAAARTLARLHTELTELSLTYQFVGDLSLIDFDWLSNYFYSADVLDAKWLDISVCDKDARSLCEIRKNLPFLRESRTELATWLEGQQNDGILTECIVHGDYYQRNILWNGRSVTAVLDWDETSTSLLEYEVANAIWTFSLEEETATMAPRIIDNFLDEYTRVRSLRSLTKQALKRLVGVRRLIEIQSDLYELRVGGSYDLEYCEQNVRGLRLLDIDAA